ncbi:hypothetical protein BHE74_00052851 [Ensete ventricosum]|nr:hypothetical protein BHE74_00052851 [Ensete ventricosum]
MGVTAVTWLGGSNKIQLQDDGGGSWAMLEMKGGGWDAAFGCAMEKQSSEKEEDGGWAASGRGLETTMSKCDRGGLAAVEAAAAEGRRGKGGSDYERGRNSDYSGSSKEIAATICRLLKRKGGNRWQAVGRRERRGDSDRGGHDRGGCGWEDATSATVEERKMMAGGWEEKRLRKGAAVGALGVGDSKEEVAV